MLGDPGVARPGALVDAGRRPRSRNALDQRLGTRGRGRRSGADGLVAGAGAVAAQLRRGRAAARSAGPRVSATTSVDHVVEPAALGERRPLPVGGVAAGERGLGQLATSSQSPSSSSGPASRATSARTASAAGHGAGVRG